MLICAADQSPRLPCIRHDWVGSKVVENVDQGVPVLPVCCMPCEPSDCVIGLPHIVLFEQLDSGTPHEMTLGERYLLYAGPIPWVMCQKASVVHGGSDDQHRDEM